MLGRATRNVPESCSLSDTASKPPCDHGLSLLSLPHLTPVAFTCHLQGLLGVSPSPTVQTLALAHQVFLTEALGLACWISADILLLGPHTRFQAHFILPTLRPPCRPASNSKYHPGGAAFVAVHVPLRPLRPHGPSSRSFTSLAAPTKTVTFKCLEIHMSVN